MGVWIVIGLIILVLFVLVNVGIISGDLKNILHLDNYLSKDFKDFLSDYKKDVKDFISE